MIFEHEFVRKLAASPSGQCPHASWKLPEGSKI